ncbi:hypothetical protein [Mucilaginibacter agri]|uniref:hypothetical protein n=1 Tax=Mucilaginibacter agri TaxID=2695265 RepID=UPI0014133DDC|nr:hypothetical protein [Mucilaginibacter agri]
MKHFHRPQVAFTHNYLATYFLKQIVLVFKNSVKVPPKTSHFFINVQRAHFSNNQSRYIAATLHQFKDLFTRHSKPIVWSQMLQYEQRFSLPLFIAFVIRHRVDVFTHCSIF